LVNCPSVPLDETTVFLQAAPVPWDAFSLELWGALLNGGRCVLLDATAVTADAQAVGRALDAGVNTLWLTSSLFNVLIEEDEDLFRRVRLLLVGGERVSVPHVRRAVSVHAGLRMVNGYGPVESTIFTTAHVVKPEDLAEGRTDVPIGRPVPGTGVVLLGPDGAPLAADGTAAEGEIAVSGDGLALGYVGDPEETAKRFVLVDGVRHYRTGDLAVVDERGNLRYRGRADQQFKIRGVRIEPGEVEAALESHPEVAACCVLKAESAPGRAALVGVYTTVHDHPVDAAVLRAHCARTLLPAMVPTELTHTARLPLGTTGKVDRKAVARLAAGRAEAPTVTATDDGLLAEIRDLLGLPALTDRDDLLDAGVTSLDVIRLAARLSARTGARVGVADVYRLRTLDALRAVDRGVVDLPPTSGRERRDPPPLSRAQQRFWLAEQTSPGDADNMIVLAYSLTGPVRPAALRQALQDVVARHPVLRTVYPWHGDAPVQRVRPPGRADVPWEETPEPVDAAGLGLQELAERVTEDWWRTPFSLEDDLPLRARLCRLADDRHLFCLQIHHIAFDGWSASVFLEDLRTAYSARAAGLPAGLAEPASDYAAYSRWEQARTNGLLRTELPYWRDALSSPREPFLPPPGGAGEAARLEDVVLVPADLVRRLTRAAGRQGGPPLAGLVAAAVRALSRTFGPKDVRIGTVTGGRLDPSVEEIVGYFVNPLVVEVPEVATGSALAVLAGSARAVVSALDHSGSPFDELVRLLNPDRRRHPWFQTWVVLQGELPHGPLGDGVTAMPVRVRPPSTAIELMIEAIPQPDGAWELVVLRRADGVGAAAAKELLSELVSSLAELAELAESAVVDRVGPAAECRSSSDAP
jgi:aryl carrier-like protein